MKKPYLHHLQTAVTLFILISISIPVSSVTLVSQKNPNTSDADTQTIRLTTAGKIDEILAMIDENLLLTYLQTIVGFGPRVSGTYGCEKAAQYIHTHFTANGLLTRYQNWTGWGNRLNFGRYRSQNVEGTLLGTDPRDTSVIIFNAHYDSVAKGPGANDDGSGTAAVLAAAYALSCFDFKRTIRFITFSGEEVGLIGSRAYAKEAYAQNDNILVEINADMIGHDEGSNKMTTTATEDAGWVAELFQRINTEYSIGLTVNRGTINRQQNGLGGSDYAAFLPYGWECIGCWEGDHDPNFHSAQDNLSNINFSYLVNTTRLIAATLAFLADIDETPPQVRITSPRVGYLYQNGMKKRQIGEFKTTVLNDIWVWAEVADETIPLQRADFYFDGTLVHTDYEYPFQWQFNRFSLRNHQITVVVYDELGRNTTDWREIKFINLLKKT